MGSGEVVSQAQENQGPPFSNWSFWGYNSNLIQRYAYRMVHWYPIRRRWYHVVWGIMVYHHDGVYLLWNISTPLVYLHQYVFNLTNLFAVCRCPRDLDASRVQTVAAFVRSALEFCSLLRICEAEGEILCCTAGVPLRYEGPPESHRNIYISQSCLPPAC